MKRLAAVAVLILGLMAPALAAGPVGRFAGTVVRSGTADASGKWVYIKARRTMRRVEISAARFEYADSIPRSARAAIPADDMKDGTLVQIAAVQDKSGEWVAQSILILRLPGDEVLLSSAYVR